jgi:hypothetical protein
MARVAFSLSIWIKLSGRPEPESGRQYLGSECGCFQTLNSSFVGECRFFGIHARDDGSAIHGFVDDAADLGNCLFIDGLSGRQHDDIGRYSLGFRKQEVGVGLE